MKDQTKLNWERFNPIILSGIGIFVFWLLDKYFVGIYDTIYTLSNSLIGVSSTMIGFFLTILTLIETINTNRMRVVKKTGNYPRLFRYLKSAIKFNLIFIGICILEITCEKYITTSNTEKYLALYRIVHYAFVLTLILSITTSVRFISIILNLMHDKTTTNN